MYTAQQKGNRKYKSLQLTVTLTTPGENNHGTPQQDNRIRYNMKQCGSLRHVEYLMRKQISAKKTTVATHSPAQSCCNIQHTIATCFNQ